MLRNAKNLEACELRARDGRIGHVRDFYFDDRQWTVRYLVVDTGGWLSGREVLISPVAVGVADWRERVLPVDLPRRQVQESPGIDTAQAVSPEDEMRLSEHYNWPVYWSAAGFADGFGLPMVPPLLPPPMGEARSARATAASGVAEHHLRSVRRVTGHRIEARDGTIGHVEDFLLDDTSWTVRYVVVDTRNWWPGKKVLVAPQWIHELSWDEAKVVVDLSRDAIKDSPAYNPAEVVTPDYAAQLHEHYGRARPPQ